MAQTNLSLQTLNGLVGLFVLDTTDFPGGSVVRVCNSRINKNTLLSEASVLWGGDIYICIPFEVANFKRGGDRPEKPKLVIPDGEMTFWMQLMELGGAPGAKVTHMQAMAKDILAGEGAISTAEYFLDKPIWDGGKLTLELSSQNTMRKSKFPSRRMTRQDFPGLGVQLMR